MGDSIITESSTLSSLEPKVPEVSACDSVSQNCSESVKSHDSESNLIGTSEDSSDTATASPSPPQTPMTWAKGKEEFGSFKNEGSENNSYYHTNITIPEKDVKDLFKQPYNELLVPVNQSKKGLRSGKLYVTKELGSEKSCCRKYFCWILLAILLLTGITLGILAIAGVFNDISTVDNPEGLKSDGDIHIGLDTNKLDDDELIIKPGNNEPTVDQSQNRAADGILDGIENELPSVDPAPSSSPSSEAAESPAPNIPEELPQDPELNEDFALEDDHSSRHGKLPSDNLPKQDIDVVVSAPENATAESEWSPPEGINVSDDVVQKSNDETQPEELPKIEDQPEAVDEQKVDQAQPDEVGISEVIEKVEDRPVAVDNETVLVPEPVAPVSVPEITLGQILQTPGPHVPDILDAEFRIVNLEFNTALENQTSEEYQKLSNEIENELRRLLIPQNLIDSKEYDFRVGVLQFKPGSVICNFRIGWYLLPGVQFAPLPFTAESLRDTLALSLTSNNGLFLNYVVPVESIVVYRVTDVCVTTPSFCGSLICGFSHEQISFACTCPAGYILSADNQFCLPVPQEDLPWAPIGAIPPESNTTQDDGAFEEVFLVPTKSENSSTPLIEDGFVPIINNVEEVKNVTDLVEEVVSVVVKNNVTENLDQLIEEIEQEIDALKNATETEDLGGKPDEPRPVLSSEKPEMIDDPSEKIPAADVDNVEDVTEVSKDDTSLSVDIFEESSGGLPQVPSNASTIKPQEVEYEYEVESEIAVEEKVDKINATDAETKEISDSQMPLDTSTEGTLQAANADQIQEDLKKKTEVSDDKKPTEEEQPEVVDQVDFADEQPEVAESENLAEDENQDVAEETDATDKQSEVSEGEKPAETETSTATAQTNLADNQPEAGKLEVVEQTDSADKQAEVQNATATSTPNSVNQFDLIGKEAANTTQEFEYEEYEITLEEAEKLGFDVMEKADEVIDDNTFLKRTIENEPSEQLIPVTDKPSIEFLSEPCGNWPIDLESSVFSSRLGASLVEWPSLARLFIVETRKSCTAVIVDKDWVLAAYSCIKKSDPAVDSQKWVLFAGGPSARGRAAPNTQIRTVEEIIVHPQAGKDADSANMVLVKINQPLTFSESLRAICVSSHAVEERQACTIVGWQQGVGRGDVTFSQYSKFLTTTKVNTSDCNIDQSSNNSNLVCSEIIEDDGICLADEGAPMMCVGRGGFWELGGLYTRSTQCSLEKSNFVFATVSGGSSFQWVKETIRR